MILIAYALLTVVAFLILFQFLQFGTASADSSVGDLQAEVEFLQLRIEENQSEYRITARWVSELREQLVLGEATLKKLNSVNNERRARLRILARKIARFLDQPS